MKKIVAILFILAFCGSAFAQNDTSKYIWYKFQYGGRMDRYKADKVLSPPLDTTYSKDGIATIGSSLYVGNGTKWTLSAGGIPAAGVDSVTARNDSLFWWASGTKTFFYKVPAGAGGVSNIATGYGLSGGPITSTGTIIADSATLANYFVRRKDSSFYTTTFYVGKGVSFSTTLHPGFQTVITDSVYLDSTIRYISGDSLRNNAGVLEVRKKGGQWIPQLTLPTGGGGAGTVTSIGKGYGLLADGTITATGTITVDSAALAAKFLRAVDTTALHAQIAANTTAIGTNTTAIATKENSLGNPATNGFVLSSTTSGTRSWVAQTTGGGSTFTTQTYTSGSTVTIADPSNWLIVNPSTVVATALTITMPANPTDREEVTISFGGTVTSGNDVVTNLTVAANTGQTLVQNFSPTYFQSGETIKYRYNLSTTKWYAQ